MQSGKKGNGSGSTHSSLPSEQTDQQVLERGQMALDLLNNQMYNDLYRYRMDRNLYEHEKSQQPHQNHREALYQQRMAIIEGPEILRGFVQEAQSILDRNASEADPAAREQRHLDEQGFGELYSN